MISTDEFAYLFSVAVPTCRCKSCGYETLCPLMVLSFRGHPRLYELVLQEEKGMLPTTLSGCTLCYEPTLC